jgi:hypothetical protein
MSISLSQLQAMVEEFPDGKIYFDTPVRIKSTPHFEVFTAHGVWAHGVNGVWVLDGLGQWHQLAEKQVNVDYIIGSVAQRLRLMKYEATSKIPAAG